MNKSAVAYKLWHEYLIHFPRLEKYTLGQKIDNLFCDLIELLLQASYANSQQKYIIISKAGIRLDALKYFLKMSWELKSIDNKKYTTLSSSINEVGKMLGGWKKQIQNLS
ncbi:four helix bundle protein [Patescibacteria group bacterium]|nr:four helix bundle protein [Patescibacteria group bacterium]MBU1952447.1 four helix bundle protein [Patescibacteria group bacterium]MBU2229400.1 four helix bundle protein [Patescibacteria group bacterium]